MVLVFVISLRFIVQSLDKSSFAMKACLRVHIQEVLSLENGSSAQLEDIMQMLMLPPFSLALNSKKGGRVGQCISFPKAVDSSSNKNEESNIRTGTREKNCSPLETIKDASVRTFRQLSFPFTKSTTHARPINVNQ